MTEQSAHVGEIDLAYEVFGDDANPALLLIMGLGTQMLGWDEAFCGYSSSADSSWCASTTATSAAPAPSTAARSPDLGGVFRR